MNRNKQYIISSLAVLAMFVSCKEVDPLEGVELGSMGIQSVTAAFTGEVYENDTDARFSATPDADGNIVVEVPWFYPETSDYEVPQELLTNMRVSATLATGTYIEPGLGVMDMTQTHHVTAYDAAGRTMEYNIRAEITKLSGCTFSSFNVTSAGTLYTGIINPTANTISLMAPGDELPDCTVAYTASPHSTVSGYTEGMSFRDGDKITVLAHNGVDKTEYTIKFAVPEKIAYGARLGSGKNLWTKYYANLGVTLASGDAPMRLAADGDVLYVLTGSGTIHSMDRKTGDYIGTVSLPSGYTANSMVSDEAGNILFAANSAATSDFKVYVVDAIDGTPEELISYSNTGYANLGNIRVTGNAKGDAVVTANSQGTAGGGVAWQITGGTAGAASVVSENPSCTSLGNTYNGCIVGATSDLSDGIFTFGYWGAYDIFYSSDRTAYTVAVDTDPAGNENTNCMSIATFNGAQYLAYGIGAHFSYGYCPQFKIVDSSVPSAMSTAELHAVPYSDLNIGGFKGVTGATSDILIVISEDGYYMDVYFTDGNYDIITCYEFDCIQQ